MGHSELKGVLVLLLSSCGACALQAEDDIAGGSTASLRAVSCAPAELIDDFNDGAAQGWVVGNPFGSPGTWSVVDGAYTFSTGVPVLWVFDQFSVWLMSPPPRYSTGYVRASVVRRTRSSRLAVVMRGNPQTFSGYTVTWDRDDCDGFFHCPDDGDGVGTLRIYKAKNFVVTPLAELGGFYWDLGRPYFLEIGAIGSTLELRIWPVEDGAEARPRQAMLTARDTDNPAGLIALLSRSYGPFELKEATFDDVTFQPMSLAGDMNGDDVVDGVDLSLLGRSLGACEDAANCPGDLDHDGDVSAQDLEAAADIAHCHMALRGHL